MEELSRLGHRRAGGDLAQGGFNPTWQRHVAAYSLCEPHLPRVASPTSAAASGTATSCSRRGRPWAWTSTPTRWRARSARRWSPTCAAAVRGRRVRRRDLRSTRSSTCPIPSGRWRRSRGWCRPAAPAVLVTPEPAHLRAARRDHRPLPLRRVRPRPARRGRARGASARSSWRASSARALPGARGRASTRSSTRCCARPAAPAPAGAAAGAPAPLRPAAGRERADPDPSAAAIAVEDFTLSRSRPGRGARPGGRLPFPAVDRTARMEALAARLHHHDPSQLAFQIREIAGERSYERHGVRVDAGATVIDAGANVGVAAVYFSELCGAGRVHSLEPVAPLFELLERNVAGLDACHAHNLGLSSRTGGAEITYYAGAGAMSGLYADPERDREFVRVALAQRGARGRAGRALAGGPPRAPAAGLRADHAVRVHRHRVDRGDRPAEDRRGATRSSTCWMGIAAEDWPRIRQVVVEVHDEGGRGEQVRGVLAEARLQRRDRPGPRPCAAPSVRMVYATTLPAPETARAWTSIPTSKDQTSGPHRWPTRAEIMLPCLDAAGARSVVEVGAYAGELTRLLADWAAESGRSGVGRRPRAAGAARRAAERARRGGAGARAPASRRSRGSSMPDAMIIDGDHNHRTVSQELRLLAERAPGAQLPLLLLHDVGWPHGRRDDYFEPELIPEEHRQPLAGRGEPGSAPGEPGTVPGGLPYPRSAAQEGGPRNGVRTAVEDFVAERDGLRLPSCRSSSASASSGTTRRPWAAAWRGSLDPWDGNPLLDAARASGCVTWPRCTSVQTELAARGAAGAPGGGVAQAPAVERVRAGRAPSRLRVRAGIAPVAGGRLQGRDPPRAEGLAPAARAAARRFSSRSGPVTRQDRLLSIASSSRSSGSTGLRVRARSSRRSCAPPRARPRPGAPAPSSRRPPSRHPASHFSAE